MVSSSSWRVDVASGIAKTPIIPRENYFSTSDIAPHFIEQIEDEVCLALHRERHLVLSETYKASIVKKFMETSFAF